MIDIWNWSLDHPVGDENTAGAILSDDERARAARFIRPRDAKRFLAGRVQLRNILGQYIGLAPSEIIFSYGINGKPELVWGGSTALHFNLSHSAGQAILAVSRRFHLGIDIEEIRPISEDVAGHFFSPAEYADLQALPLADQISSFYRCWTRKEAFIKAHGAGLSLPLDCFDVSLADNAGQTLLRRLDPLVGRAEDWALLNLDVDKSFCGALAALTFGEDVVLRYRDFSL